MDMTYFISVLLNAWVGFLFFFVCARATTVFPQKWDLPGQSALMRLLEQGLM